MRAIRERMDLLLAEVEAEYDFARFTMDGFAQWLGERRGRPIVRVPYRIPTPTTSGVWLAGDHRDFVFYEQNALPIHQTHIQLHEMAHMLCGHPTLRVGQEGLSVLFRGMAAGQEIESLVIQLEQSDEAESEAEVLASLIQKTVLQHGRMRELLAAPSSHQTVADFIVNAELD